MKWIYIIAEKIKAALALGIVFVLVLVTNLLDKNHFTELQESFTSIYEDRLMVENYIYKISGHLGNKKMLHDSSQFDLNRVISVNHALNDSIQTLIAAYEQTKFTAAESTYFRRFKDEFEELQVLEKKHFTHGEEPVNLPGSIRERYEKLDLNLDNLSDIQLSESRRILDNSNRIISTSNVTSRLEIVILIVIGLIVQALIFTSKSLKPKVTQNGRMN